MFVNKRQAAVAAAASACLRLCGTANGFVALPGPLLAPQSAVQRVHRSTPSMSIPIPVGPAVPPQGYSSRGGAEKDNMERIVSTAIPVPPSPGCSTSGDAKEDNQTCTESVTDEHHYNRLLEESRADSSTLLVVTFTASSCRACKGIEQRFKKTVAYHGPGGCGDARFARIDFEANKELCKKLGIRTLPQVHIFSGANEKVADFCVAPLKYSKLNRFLERYRRAGLTAATAPASSGLRQ